MNCNHEGQQPEGRYPNNTNVREEISYREACDHCGALRWVEVHEDYIDVGPWEEPEGNLRYEAFCGSTTCGHSHPTSVAAYRCGVERGWDGSCRLIQEGR